MDLDVVLALKNRYSELHPLLFNRSIERAKDESELFDIVDTVPVELPISWDGLRRRWLPSPLLQLPNFNSQV